MDELYTVQIVALLSLTVVRPGGARTALSDPRMRTF